MSELYDQIKADFMRDSTEYCCYCGTEKHGIGCCGENHFYTFAEMDEQTQREFIESEM